MAPDHTCRWLALDYRSGGEVAVATIELGFAAWELAPDLRASIVDVPGHEGFVRP